MGTFGTWYDGCRINVLGGATWGLLRRPWAVRLSMSLDESFAQLTAEQQEWLWVRYVERFPAPCQQDQDASNICATRWQRGLEAIRKAVTRWRDVAAFSAVESALSAGTNIRALQSLIVAYEASNALSAVQERGKLIRIPWSELGAKEMGAKAAVIRDSIKTVLDYAAGTEGGKSIGQVQADNPEVAERNYEGGSDAVPSDKD